MNAHSATTIGVDPGGRDTGVIARRGRELLYAATVHRGPTRSAYLEEVLETVDLARRAAGPVPLAAIGVEDVNEPTGFRDGEREPIALEPLITTAMVAAAVIGRFAGVVLVPPGHNGQGPLEVYPAELVGPRERHGRYGKLRHVRSAWDVAGLAAIIVRESGYRPPPDAAGPPQVNILVTDR